MVVINVTRLEESISSTGMRPVLMNVIGNYETEKHNAILNNFRGKEEGVVSKTRHFTVYLEANIVSKQLVIKTHSVT